MFRRIAVVSLLAIVAQLTSYSQYLIDTFAGGGPPMPAAALSFALAPEGVAVDGAGNVYVLSWNRVFKVTPQGNVTVVAGTGMIGYSGDGGPAVEARLNYPRGLAVDGAGNLYVPEFGRVRKISAAGVITTVVGNGGGDCGDGSTAVAVDGAGNLYVAASNIVCKVTGGVITRVAGAGGAQGYSGDGGPATSAKLGFVEGLALDTAGNVYIADTGNNRIRRVSGGVITTVAGGGATNPGDGGAATSAVLSRPRSLAVDGAGNLYINSDDTYRVRKVSGGIITTVAGTGSYGNGGDGGPATSAALSYVTGLATDSAGNLYIGDYHNFRVRKVAGGIINRIAGTGRAYSGDGGPATSAQVNAGSIAVDNAGNVYFADASAIRKVTGGLISTVLGSEAVGALGVSALAVDGAGSLYFAAGAFPAVIMKATGSVITVVAGGGSTYPADGVAATAANLSLIYGMAVDGAGNIYFTELNIVRKVSGGVITTLAGNGRPGFSDDGVLASAAQVHSPEAIAVDGAGSVYFSDSGNGRTRKIAGGVLTTVAGGSGGLAFDSAGNLYTTAAGHRVSKVSGGVVTTLAGVGVAGFSGDGGPATNAELNDPRAIAVDAAGNVYVSDMGNYRIRRLTPTPTVQVTVTSTPAGRTIVVDGTVLTAPQTFAWGPGTTHTISADELHTGGAGTLYAWASWSDGGARSHTITVPGSAATYTATFGTQYLLTRTASGGTIAAVPTSGDGYYSAGATVALTAAASGGFQFTGWSGDLGGVANPQTVTMNAPRTVVANFGAVAMVTRRIGFFRTGMWLLDLNGNGGWDGTAADRLYWLGQTGDTALVGDWNGDGRGEIGFFRAGMWLLDFNGNGSWDGTGVDRLYWLGQAGDVPLVGDWNGDGRDEVGLFRAGMWLIDYNGNGGWDGPGVDRLYWLGQAGDAPLVGDWNGDGKAEVGFFRAGMWLIDYNGNGGWDGPAVDRLYWLGQAGDAPLVGDWNGDGKAEVGFFRAGMWLLDFNGNGGWDGPGADRLYWLGQAEDVPLVGDFNSDGRAEIGFFRAGMWLLDFNGNGGWDGPGADRLHWLGQAGDVPLAGRW